MAQNLGRAISILLEPHLAADRIAAELNRWNAPSECYRILEITPEEQRLRLRHACHVAGVKNRRLLRKAIRARIGDDAPIYRRYGFIPY